MAPVPSVLVPADQLQRRVRALARSLSVSSEPGVVLVSVLKGSLPFLADLVRQLTVEPVVEFLAISTYAPDSGRVRLVKDLDLDIGGRDVVVVEDIVDTGLTATWLLGELGRRDPARLRLCTLVDKPARRILPVPIDLVGVEVPDVFVLGYGLDFAGRYRNLDLLVAGDPSELARDPDVYVPALYGSGIGPRGGPVER